MSLKEMLECIKKNDLKCLKIIMEDEDTYLTGKICTQLLVKSLELSHLVIANYIIKYNFDLDAIIFQQYLETNSPFTEKQIVNLNKILSRFYICCMVDT